MLTIGVAGLGVVNFLLGFAPFAKEDPKATSSDIFGYDRMNFFDNASLGAGIVGIALLLLAGVISGLGLLPNQVPNNIVVAAASITGFVTLLFTLIGLSEGLEVGVGLIFVIVFGFIRPIGGNLALQGREEAALGCAVSRGVRVRLVRGIVLFVARGHNCGCAGFGCLSYPNAMIFSYRVVGSGVNTLGAESPGPPAAPTTRAT